MATTFKTCDSFWAEAFQGIHTKDDVYKIAIFQRTGAGGLLGQNTTAYAATVNGAAEVTGAGYSAGGAVLAPDTNPGSTTNVVGAGATVRLDSTAHKIGLDWAAAVFSMVTLNGLKENGFYALIYNSSKANRAVAVGEWQTNDLAANPNTADFTITLPSTGTMAVFVAT